MLFQEIKEELLRMFKNSEYLDGYELDILHAQGVMPAESLKASSLKEEFNEFYKNEIYPFYKYSLDVEQQEQVEEIKKLVNKLCENVA